LEPALREARVCFDHLAGDRGVSMLDSLVRRGHVEQDGEALTLTTAGRAAVEKFGIDVAALDRARRPVCMPRLEYASQPHGGWSGRRFSSTLLRDRVGDPPERLSRRGV
jgi:hypothetical protein